MPLPAHLAFSRVRRFDRSDYSLRPGERLSDYLLAFDVSDGKDRRERFQINHHPYRLQQSRCFRESAEGLSCLRCHDPHRRVPAAERQEHYRRACLQCHREEECRLPELPPPQREVHHLQAVPSGDCITCHMPRRRTQDVVHVVMTDHLIQRPSEDLEALLAPRSEALPEVPDVELMPQDEPPQGALGEVYRHLVLLRAQNAGSLEPLARALAVAHPQTPAPYLELAQAELKTGRFRDARGVLETLVARYPEHPLARTLLGLALSAEERLDEAEMELRRAREATPGGAAAAFYLAETLLRRSGREREALALLDEAVGELPNLAPVWLARGQALGRLGRYLEASESFERALALDPRRSDAYLDLAQALVAAGLYGEALRYLEQGARVVADPRPVADALATLERQELSYWQQRLQREPERLEARLGVGQALLHLGRADEAVAELSRVLRRDPSHRQARHLRAQASYGLGRLSEAQADLERLIRDDPGDLKARHRLAEVLSSQGMLDAARRELLDLLARARLPLERASVHRQLAAILAQQAELEAAREHLRRALDDDPDDLEARYELAAALGRLGRLEEARQELARLLEASPGNVQARSAEAQTLVLLGRLGEARQRLEQGLEASGGALPLAELLARLLATAPDSSLRDPARALALAQRVQEAEPTPENAALLAAAYAAGGHRQEAVRWQEIALEQAASHGVTGAALERLRRDLDAFRDEGKCCPTAQP